MSPFDGFTASGAVTPACRSLEAAVAAYEKAGGSASIFINDDGLQLMSPEAQLARIRFYRQHNIGCATVESWMVPFSSQCVHCMCSPSKSSL